MEMPFLSKSYLIILIVCITQYSCGQSKLSEMQLKKYIDHSFFDHMINDDSFRGGICGITNFTYKPYTNDSIGINRFIAYLLCSGAHYSILDLYENYFGTGEINNLNLNSNYISFPNFDSLQEYKKPIYIKVGFQFMNNHFKKLDSLLNMIKPSYIYPFGGYYSLFLMILDDVRQKGYKNIDQYIPSLIQFYNHTVDDEYLISDMVLDVIRRSKSPTATNFLKGKHFLSDDFNSHEFIHVYDSIGDKGYIKYVNPSVLRKLTH